MSFRMVFACAALSCGFCLVNTSFDQVALRFPFFFFYGKLWLDLCENSSILW